MGYTIAIAGKGGSGKTTISGLITVNLIKNGLAPVLAIDADPNICLDTALGVTVNKSVGSIREEAREIVSENKNEGITKRELLELKISESLVESENFDLIAMGRPEGAGCYCYANNVLREVIKELTNAYPFIVIDNEAGLENISRRIISKIDLLMIVGDPSMNGIKTIKRLYELANDMELEYKKSAVIINRLRDDNLPEGFDKHISELNVDHILKLPFDTEVADFGEQGKSFKEISEPNSVSNIISTFLDDVMKEQLNG